MGDLRTPFNQPAYPDATDLNGATVISRGSDPNAAGGDGPAALRSPFEKPITMATSQEESANSQSGLPSLPNRWEPSDTVPAQPNLTDRRPGTIDQR